MYLEVKEGTITSLRSSIKPPPDTGICMHICISCKNTFGVKKGAAK